MAHLDILERHSRTTRTTAYASPSLIHHHDRHSSMGCCLWYLLLMLTLNNDACHLLFVHTFMLHVMYTHVCVCVSSSAGTTCCLLQQTKPSPTLFNTFSFWILSWDQSVFPSAAPAFVCIAAWLPHVAMHGIFCPSFLSVQPAPRVCASVLKPILSVDQRSAYDHWPAS